VRTAMRAIRLGTHLATLMFLFFDYIPLRTRLNADPFNPAQPLASTLQDEYEATTPSTQALAVELYTQSTRLTLLYHTVTHEARQSTRLRPSFG
jgi:hypothetical protein